MFLVCAAHGQNVLPKQKMDQLSRFVGEWSGEGYHIHKSHTNYFDQTLKIESRLDGTLFLVEARATLKDEPQKVIHHSITNWQYDVDGGVYTASNFRWDGKNSMSNFEVHDGIIISFSEDSQLKKISKIDDQGTYLSYWEQKQDDGFWKRIFEVRMSM